MRPGSTLSSEFESQSRLTKAKSIGYLDKKLDICKPSVGGDQEQKENQPQQGSAEGDGLCSVPLSRSSLSLGPFNHGHKRTLSLSHTESGASSATIRKKISEWECRKVAKSRMSLCFDKRPGGGGEGCSSLLSSPCSEKTLRRMSTAFSECSYPETEEDEGTSDRECLRQFQRREREKRHSKTEASGIFLRTLPGRKETSAVLNRIQKIEQALKESPSPAPPQYLSNCYGPDKSRQKSFNFGGTEDLDSSCGSKRSSICSVATEPDTCSGLEKLSKFRQRFSVSSIRSESLELPSAQGLPGTPVNPLPKPKRTFEYDADRNHKDSLPSNGLPPNSETTPTIAHHLKRSQHR